MFASCDRPSDVDEEPHAVAHGQTAEWTRGVVHARLAEDRRDDDGTHAGKARRTTHRMPGHEGTVREQVGQDDQGA